MGSPASGDYFTGHRYLSFYEFPFNWDPQRVGTVDLRGHKAVRGNRFHSIGIPSEWGLHDTTLEKVNFEGFPFNWDPQRVGTSSIGHPLRTVMCFHSIGIPSEWGLNYLDYGGKWFYSFHSIGIPSEWGLGGYPIALHRPS